MRIYDGSLTEFFVNAPCCMTISASVLGHRMVLVNCRNLRMFARKTLNNCWVVYAVYGTERFKSVI